MKIDKLMLYKHYNVENHVELVVMWSEPNTPVHSDTENITVKSSILMNPNCCILKIPSHQIRSA